ncbi:hypothetical protein LSH36_1941g00036 [Paralvinella palmiformis]|uniref:Uncharacterized protein n=1 Tax=Paralvinella palmiformis TaxID=53620 RepID=A0AAD9MLB5_9ANNE|nr:hypothetical protein LSH36_1941g00036 [Paralvinella palmiformis]
MASVITMFIMYTLMTTITAVNIALDKPTGQIGAYGGAKEGRGATSDKAVDGHYDVDDGSEYYLTVCAHPSTAWHGSVPAKWLLEMNNFTVEVVTSDNRTTQSCGEYREADPVRRGGNYTFNCNSKQGRYVYVRRLQGSRQQYFMTLCEVVIDGFIMITSSSSTRTPTPKPTTTTTTTTTNTTDQLKCVTCTLSWVLFGVSCVINIVFATLYFIARKQLSQPSNHSENFTHGQTTLSYINNSSDVEIENQQPINTQNIDSNGYEDVNIRNIHLTVRQREDMITEKTPQYEKLQGQVSDDVTNTHYESIH